MGDETDQAQREAEAFAAELLNPDRLRERLVHIGFFLFAYELLKDLAISQLRSFYSNGFSVKNGKMVEHLSDEYQTKVLSLAKYEFEASLRWYAAGDVISDADVTDILSFIDYRNRLAHEPHKLVLPNSPIYQESAVRRLRAYHRRIGQFWGQVAIDTDPEFDGKDVSSDGVAMLSSVLLDLMAASLADSRK